MTAFSSISEFAIGESGRDGLELVVQGGTITVLAYPPTIFTGASVRPPAAEIIVQGQDPALHATNQKDTGGSLAETSLGESSFAEGPSGARRAVLQPGFVDILVQGQAPSVYVGARVDVPTATIVVAGIAPAVNVGDHLDIPTANIVVNGVAPRIEISATVQPPAADIVVQGQAPDIRAGVNINPQTTKIDSGGVLAESALAEFAFGEGQQTSFTYNINILVEARVPSIRAGVRLNIPTANILVEGQALYEVSAGASVEPNTTPDIAVQTVVPDIIGGGASTRPPAAPIIVQGQAPGVFAGARVDVPTSNIVVQGQAPRIAAGKSVFPPYSTIFVQAVAPQEVSAGASVRVGHADIILNGVAPGVFAGARVDVPTSNIVVNGRTPEIDARKRSVAVRFIASR